MTDQTTTPRWLNFRDLGGIQTVNHRRLRPGRLMRSAAFDTLDATDAAALRDMGLRRVADLRSAPEQKAQPSPLVAAGFEMVITPPAADPSNLMAHLSAPGTTPAEMRQSMIDLYAAMPDAFATSYAEVMKGALEGDGALLVHCAIGKDRTGTAVALLLTALGVADDAIITDYLATNAAVPAIAATLHQRLAGTGLPPLSDQLIAPVLAADPAYLAAFRQTIATRHGNEFAYMRDMLDFGPDRIEALRAAWLD